ncbi:MAG: ATP-binding protein [Lachnospiraceae bacterium]|nr:ATP-binding protein [Lachnospiraceae bacterium]
MKPINIFILTRIEDEYDQMRLERQMSLRNRFLKVKEWEMKGLRTFSDRICGVMENGTSLEFFYSFTMPKLGKEFDLLRIGSDSIVNIELKSGNVSDEAIKKQLDHNRYYLATLDRAIYSYTYISETDRLVRLSGGGRLIETSWDELAVTLNKQQDIYEGHIEELFREDRYLISPLTDPLRFLRGDYFLTAQQKDIRNLILKDVLEKPGVIRKRVSVHGFTGLPGTGKTILLYDIAMQLSASARVCVLHFGSHEKELEHLDERLKRVDFYYCSGDSLLDLKDEYRALLIDEGHRLSASNLKDVMGIAKTGDIPVIISYDREDPIAYEERNHDGSELIESIEGFHGYKLTNRIRLNSELSSFISGLMYPEGSHRRDFSSVSLAWASDDEQADMIIKDHISQGYVYIYDDGMQIYEDCGDTGTMSVRELGIEVNEATCREFDRVVMLIDESFAYDEKGYLRSASGINNAGTSLAGMTDVAGTDTTEYSVVRNLFHGLSRGKDRIAIVVKNNKAVFGRILTILQGRPDQKKRVT